MRVRTSCSCFVLCHTVDTAVRLVFLSRRLVFRPTKSRRGSDQNVVHILAPFVSAFQRVWLLRGMYIGLVTATAAFDTDVIS